MDFDVHSAQRTRRVAENASLQEKKARDCFAGPLDFSFFSLKLSSQTTSTFQLCSPRHLIYTHENSEALVVSGKMAETTQCSSVDGTRLSVSSMIRTQSLFKSFVSSHRNRVQHELCSRQALNTIATVRSSPIQSVYIKFKTSPCDNPPICTHSIVGRAYSN